ncbi:MAG: cbb3-type cytochrome c oxidase subunit IV [Chlorobi bacterium OLB5]|nr:MAG: cbb3-type cytochrome c oxidase subunit IV [Chlorobi bacterium OLB5]
MYKKVLENITGIEIYPEISLIIFFVFFLLILGWIFTLNKSYIKKMENIPLDESETENKHSLNAGGVK